ncbi:prolyl endopeptidase [Kitasatospora herbaricolor]|uniref:prolyl oligopeptidase family serine peptidase n=1 Tax=Kitasatospora herbaricolor TaxID=68217 RepID=UPI00174B77F1|nr:prolyl oligopeptidase family serine peptidase [Kitasatospora herbaricolor]MDQ0311388.1 prolyl oligopeptidase [Kitasatospora herbaricolor]GGV22666.1 prolyl endopeptidase [Kitasatospora herbaricolor]
MTGPHEYPPAPRTELTERLHGHLVADPYRTLEDPQDPRTAAWSAAQDELYRRARSGWPMRAVLGKRVRDLLDTGAVSVPQVHGARHFHTRRLPGEDRPSLVVTEDGTTRTLFDPAALDPAGGTVLDEWSAAPDGSRVAVQSSTGGTEDSVLRVLDTATGELLSGPIDRLRRSTVAWLPDATAFYYVRRLPPELHPGEERYHRRVWLHRVGTDPAEDVLVFGDGRAADQYYAVDLDGPLLTVTATAGASPRTDVWLADLTAGSPERPVLRPVQEGVDARTIPCPRGGVLYLRTHRSAPRGRVEVAEGELRRVLVAQDPEAVLEDFAVLDGPGLERPLALVVRTRHAIGEIAVHDLATGERVGEVALPGSGTVTGLRVRREPGHEAWFGYTDHVTPTQVLRHDARTGRTTLWAAPAGAPDTAVRTSRIVYRSHDGTPVRMFVISPAGRPDRPRPTLLSGYGGFGASVLPGYAAQAVAWAEAGGVYAFACLRGGGEEGEEWHRAGRRERKQNTFDDLDAAADALVAGGWADPGRLGLVGSSNGGLTVAAAFTQHPEKYAAVVCAAPLLDMVRYERSGMGRSWRDEYGSAEDPAGLATLLGYSPYHRVRPGVRYPAVLFGVADGDTRVDPLHARKMCAALQHDSAGAGPVLLRQESGVGHGVRGTASTAGLFTDVLAFLADRLGLDG